MTTEMLQVAGALALCAMLWAGFTAQGGPQTTESAVVSGRTPGSNLAAPGHSSRLGSNPFDADRVPSNRIQRDTLRASVEAGTPLIVSLPVKTSAGPVSGYRIARAPALAGVVGRSMTWVTRASDAGAHEILLEARHPDAPTDTVTVLVDVGR